MNNTEMFTILLLLLLGAQAESSSVAESVRLVGGASRCAGTVEVRHRDEWSRVSPDGAWDLETAAVVCRDLDCGSAVSAEDRRDFPLSSVWRISEDCVKEKKAVTECVKSGIAILTYGINLVCSDSVRLSSGPSLCSGLLQIHQDQSWTSVCDGALDLQDAEVLCRELGCGAPSVLQGAPSAEGGAPLGLMFHCEGHESALINCHQTSSDTCPSGAAVTLTCSEPVRLVGGASRCAGILEVRHRDEWRRASSDGFRDLEAAAGVCRDLDCGAAVSVRDDGFYPIDPVWIISGDCVKEKKAAVKECISSADIVNSFGVDLVCSGAEANQATAWSQLTSLLLLGLAAGHMI